MTIFQSSIIRCGQPLVGPTNRRCKEDETILNCLLSTSKGVIVDTRSKALAQSAKSKGTPTENLPPFFGKIAIALEV